MCVCVSITQFTDSQASIQSPYTSTASDKSVRKSWYYIHVCVYILQQATIVKLLKIGRVTSKTYSFSLQ